MHDHVCSDANKGLGNAKVAEFDDGVVRVLVEERALKVSGPVSQPWEGAAGEVLNEWGWEQSNRSTKQTLKQ